MPYSLDTIPVELVDNIVQLAWGSDAQAEDDMFSSISKRHSIELLPFHLASVSHRLRAAALETHSMWRMIYIKFHSKDERTQKQLRYLDLVLPRSKSTPLSVFLSRVPENLDACNSLTTRSLISILPRIRRLAIWTSSEVITGQSLLTQLPQITSSLNYLSFVMNWAPSSSVHNQPLFIESDRLTELHLCNVDMQAIRLGQYAHLTTLHLTSCATGLDHSIILDLGRLWPKLRCVTIDRLFDDDESPEGSTMCPLLDLVELNLHSVAETQAFYYFGYCLTFPSLKTLSAPFALVRLIDTADHIERLHARVSTFYSSAVPNLVQLTVTNSYLDGDFVSLVLSACTRLRSLTLSQVRCSHIMFDAWVASHAVSKLEDLRFLYCRFLSHTTDDASKISVDLTTSIIAFLRYFRGNTASDSYPNLHIEQVMDLAPNKLSPHTVRCILEVMPEAIIREIHDF